MDFRPSANTLELLAISPDLKEFAHFMLMPARNAYMEDGLQTRKRTRTQHFGTAGNINCTINIVGIC